MKGAGGKELNIIDYTASRWTDIAIAMDFDDTGHTQKTIQDDYNNVTKRCNATFGMWLEGQGRRQPATWSMLIQILKECKLNALAVDIEEMLTQN